MDNSQSCHDGKLIVISGPSGAGKSTVVRRLLEDCPLPLQLSVSATTRAPVMGRLVGSIIIFCRKRSFEPSASRAIFSNARKFLGEVTGMERFDLRFRLV